jgi:tagaturonate epimerase
MSRAVVHDPVRVAAAMGKRFTDALEANEEGVGRNVTENLFDRQLLPIFA